MEVNGFIKFYLIFTLFNTIAEKAIATIFEVISTAWNKVIIT